jgi:hypothetical protein
MFSGEAEPAIKGTAPHLTLQIFTKPDICKPKFFEIDSALGKKELIGCVSEGFKCSFVLIFRVHAEDCRDL